MKRAILLILLPTLVHAQLRQERTNRANIPRVAALQGKFEQFSNPVSRTFAVSRLGAVVCKYDRVVGSGILRTGIGELNLIPADAFSETSVLLPVPSFTKLTRIVVGLAGQCDSSLGIHLAPDSVAARIREEKTRVNSWITEARVAISEKPDRAAQLLSAAISAADPGNIDMAKLVRCLSELRDRAPELADDVSLKPSSLPPSTTHRFLHISANLENISSRRSSIWNDPTGSRKVAKKKSANPRLWISRYHVAVRIRTRSSPTFRRSGISPGMKAHGPPILRFHTPSSIRWER